MKPLTFEEARHRLNNNEEVWFCLAKHSWNYDITLSKDIPPTRLGDFDPPFTVKLWGKEIHVSRRYYVMGKQGKATKKSYVGYDSEKPLELYRSQEECIIAYNAMLDEAVATLKNSIERLDGGVKHFESMKL